MIATVLSLPLLAALVAAHARITVPQTWSGFARGNCVQAAATAPVLNWVAGQEAAATWFIQASDGAGAVTFSLDPAGGTAFSVPLRITKGDPSPRAANQAYPFSFIVPDVACTGPKGCSVRAVSTSNWVSCFSVTIASQNAPAPAASASAVAASPAASKSAAAVVRASASASPSTPPSRAPGASASPSASKAASPSPKAAAPTTQPTTPDDNSDDPKAACIVATGLQLCDKVNGKSIKLNDALVPDSERFTPAEFEAIYVQKTYELEANNTNVFKSANSTECATRYLSFLCSRHFLSCGETAPTMSSCQKFNNACQLTDEHAFLYDCTDPTVANGAAKLDSYPATVDIGSGSDSQDDSVLPGTSTKPVSSVKPGSSIKPAGGLGSAAADRLGAAVSFTALVAAGFLVL